MTRRFQILAGYVRDLADDDLNDVLVELPPKWFAALCNTALARPCLPDAVQLSLHRDSRGPGEASRRTVWVDRPWTAAGWSAPGSYPHELGAVAREHRSVAGRGVWRAWTRRGAPVTVDGFTAWSRRLDAATALAWVSSASGARAAAVAAYVRSLNDTTLNDLLVELPCRRFDQVCDAAFPEPTGVAA